MMPALKLPPSVASECMHAAEPECVTAHVVLAQAWAQVPEWLRACQQCMARSTGLSLDLAPSSTAAAQADITLVLTLESAKQRAPMSSKHLWYLTDGCGAPVNLEQPMWAAAMVGQGLSLQLWRVRSASASQALSFAPLAHMHIAATGPAQSHHQQVGQLLSRLLQHAWRTQASPWTKEADAQGRQAVAPPPHATPATLSPGQRVGLQLRGAWRTFWQRQASRFLSERWRIGLVKAPIHAWLSPDFSPAVDWITPEQGHRYHADPVGMIGSRHRLFCEVFDEGTGRGRLVCLTLDDRSAVQHEQAVAGHAMQHVSFPQLLAAQGRVYGLLESSADRVTTLHEVGADGQWRPLGTLLEGIAAADPTLFQWEGRYWLAYTDADLGEHDNLCLQYADGLHGPWTPHAHNPVKVDIRGARMAGAWFEHEGQLYRPAQDCLGSYGAGLVIHRVLHCSPTHYREEEVRRITPDPKGPCPDGMHTLSAWGEQTLIDGKRLAWSPWAMARKVQRRLGLQAPQARPSTARLRHVAVVIPHLRLGGGELSMLRVAHGLVRLGLRVSLIVNTLRSQEVPVPKGVEVLELGCEGTLSGTRALAHALRGLQPQVVFSAFPHTNVSTVWAARRAGPGIRCVVSEHAPLSMQIEREGGWRYRVLPPLVRWAYRRADAVVAVSEGVAHDLKGLLGQAQRVAVINNPVLDDHEQLDPLAPPEHPWLADKALKVVISVSRLSVEKDIPTLMRAFAQLHAQRPETRLLLLGEGPERPHLEALRAELGLLAVVQLPGRVHQPRRWVQHAAAFGLASHYEGFGNVLIEALSCGVPVVSTDCPVGPRDILAGGQHGQLVAVGDWRGMSQALLVAIDQGQAPAGAKEQAARFTESSSSQAYLRLFESLL
jgi:glycosyltransferase involved in cell wall biosynthesis